MDFPTAAFFCRPDMAPPATNAPLKGNGGNAWFGWPSSPTIEALCDRWFKAPDFAAAMPWPSERSGTVVRV